MRTVLDVETTTWSKDWKEGEPLEDTNPSPYIPANKLVCIGLLEETPETGEGKAHILFSDSFHKAQEILTSTTLLIGHNLKFDLSWIKESGLQYDGEIWDTKLCEYIESRGRSWDTDLNSCLARHFPKRADLQKHDILETYFKQGVNTDKIPREELAKYLEQDLRVTWELYLDQEKPYSEELTPF